MAKKGEDKNKEKSFVVDSFFGLVFTELISSVFSGNI